MGKGDPARRTVAAYYGFQLFFSLLLWLPVFYEYQRRIGLTDAQIFHIQSVYYLAFCLLEIPTGLAADRWGYLRCLRLGSLVLVLSNVLPAIFPSYGGMLAHFLLIALARALVSGASSAYLYEYLTRAGFQGGHYKKAEGNARAFGLLAKVLLWSAVGALMEWHLALPYWLTAVTSAVAVIFVWRLPELEGARAPVSASVARGAGWQGPLLALWRAPLVPWVMLQGVAAFVLARVLQVNLFQPLLAAKGFSVASFGAVMALMTLFEALGSFAAGGRVFKKSSFGGVSVLTLGVVAGLVITAVSRAGGIWGACTGLALFSLCIGILFPMQRQLMNEVIPDPRFRATLLSVESIVDRAICAWVALSLGEFVATGRVVDFLLRAAGISTAVILTLSAGLSFGVRWMQARGAESLTAEFRERL
ncbi:MAG: MFS transporter [Oligoflexia bacterium]|nr:MFS transporter [Oligoflexia bacterium]